MRKLDRMNGWKGLVFVGALTGMLLVFAFLPSAGVEVVPVAVHDGQARGVVGSTKGGARDALAPEARTPVPVQLATPAVVDEAVGPAGAVSGVIIGPTGQPLAGAMCSLFAGEAFQGMRFGRFVRERPRASVASVVSDAFGRFELAAPGGFWTLRVEYAGLRTWVEDSVSSGSYWRVLMDRRRVLVIHVRDTEGGPIEGAEVLILENPYTSQASALDSGVSGSTGLVELELQPGDSWYVKVVHPEFIGTYFKAPQFGDALLVERTVTLDKGIRIVGQVLDAQTQMVPPGAVVLIDELGPRATLAIEVDATGRFDSGSIYARDGELELTVRAPGYGEVRRALELEWEPLEEGSFEVDFELHSGDVRIEGRVLAEDGTPVGPVDLFLQPLEPGKYTDAIKLRSRAVDWRPFARTNSEGEFAISGLAIDQVYRLLVLPRLGYGNVLVRVPEAKADTVRDLGVITVTVGASLTGRIRHADGAPAVHMPVFSIRTSIVDGDDPEFFPSDYGGRLDVYTDQAGSFEFTGMRAGLKHDIYWGGTYQFDRLIGSFTPAPGERIGPIEFTLPDEPEDQVVSLRGLVLDVEGVPVGSVLVEVWDGPETEIIGEGFVTGRLTKDDGIFEMSVAPSTEYRVTATDLRGRFDKASQAVVNVQAGESIWFEMVPSPEPSKLLQGVVVDASGEPLEDMAVTLYLSPLLVRCDCLAWSDRTDAQGHFSFGSVVAGRHQVAVVDPTGRLKTQMVFAEPGEALSILME